MSVEGARRFCDRCSQHVHDLSAMPESEARAVLARAEEGERVCVRYHADARGEIRFRPADVVPTSSLSRIAATRRAAAALAGSGIAVALAA